MGCLGKSVPWIYRFAGRISDFMGCFPRRNRPDLCHIVAEKRISGHLFRPVSHAYASLSACSDFCSVAGVAPCGCKYRILRVKNVSSSEKNGEGGYAARLHAPPALSGPAGDADAERKTGFLFPLLSSCSIFSLRKAAFGKCLVKILRLFTAPSAHLHYLCPQEKNKAV